MKIPKKVKVGGVTYKVNITNKLDLGYNYSGEITTESKTINIRPSENMEITFLHELMHAVFFMMGERNHDEKLIEALAQCFLAIIKDNKNIFKED